MRFKIKVKPEDFIVKEVASLPLVENGEFGAYLLEKSGWNTIDLLLVLARKLSLPFGYFAYGGRKDRHALTSQYITIKSAKSFNLREKNYSLKRVGSMNRPMSEDLIMANEFEVTVRSLDENGVDSLSAKIQHAGMVGYPNYFDDQRFGSFDPARGFWAEKVLKRQFNGALMAYLTSIYTGDKREEKERKKFFFENWKDWQSCLNRAKTKLEKEAFAFLLTKGKNGFLQLLKAIPHDEASLFVLAYQSYLWNETLRRIIKEKKAGEAVTYPGAAGEYIFYIDLNKEDTRYLEKLSIPLAGARAEFDDGLTKNIYTRVLEDNGLKGSMFNKLKVRSAFFKSFKREAVVKPRGLKFKFINDDLYIGGKKLMLEFSLPRGSFATMFIKRIFS